MISFEEARSQVLERAFATTRESVPIERALGRVLREDIRARDALPPWDYSTMDGYAVRSTDVPRDGGVRLEVSGEACPGEPPGVLPAGRALRIFTGARLPEGADAVVMQEQVERDGAWAIFRASPRPFLHVRRRGDDLSAGGLAIAVGRRIRSADVALAASLDFATLCVGASPRLTVMVSGSELRRPGEEGKTGLVPDSNGVALCAMARSAGAEVAPLVHVQDDISQIDGSIGAALAESDLLVTVGGVSVGDHDLVQAALLRAGVQVEFWRVAMKPGKPILFGTCGRHLVLGLPGNPVSALLTFGLFGVPLLRAMQGDNEPLPRILPATLERAVLHERGRTEFVRGKLSTSREGVSAVPLHNQSSAALIALAEGDALLVLPEDAGSLAVGAHVDAIPLTELCA